MTIVDCVVNKTKEKVESSTDVLKGILRPAVEGVEEIALPARDPQAINQMEKVERVVVDWLVNLNTWPYVGTEMVMVHEVPFPPRITTSKPLSLLGQGITDIEIHFLQVKFTAIGVYLDPSDVKIHLEKWKGKTGKDLAGDDDFFDALASGEIEKVIRVVVIKEIKGAQYGVQLENSVRDRLAAEDKYEEEEETELEKVVGFFQSKYFKTHSIITYRFSAKDGICEIGFETEGKEEEKLKVENANVVGMMQKWYLSGSRGVSPSTIVSLANSLSAVLT